MKRILVVEDDAVNQTILQDFLAANGYDTIAASTGTEGMERFARDAPDLVLVDVQLPQLDGVEVLRRMKTARGIAIPVLLMSAEYRDRGRDSASRMVQHGALADGYVCKPFDLAQLLAQVRRLLGDA